jgi:hypothetical protein
MPRRAAPLLAGLLLLAGCRDSPREVMQKATEAASHGDLVELQESFTATTVQRLERAWGLGNTPPTEGWRSLAQKLLFEGQPLEIRDEEIHGEYARVDARAGVEQRDYYLRKEDGHWRIELGAGLRYEKAARAEKGAQEPASAAPASTAKAR